MKTRNILHAFLTCAFFFGIWTMNAQTKIYLYKSDGTTAEYDIADIDSISFTPPATVADYSKLRLNEVSGVGNDSDKFYELINIGDVDIPLTSCKIYYNNDPFGTAGDGSLTWTGCADQVIKAGELLTLIGRNTPCSFTTGLTAQRCIKITLRDPKGSLIDEFIRAQDTGDYAITDKSFSRIPDGTGSFYFTTPTPNVLNGTSAEGLPGVPATKDNLVINEVDGNGKFVEIYNKGTESASLEGLTLVKNESGTWWTGGAGVTIAAGGFYTVAQQGGAEGADEYNGAGGISAKKNVKFELKKDQNVIDYFVRSTAVALDADVTPDYGSGTKYSFSRCPDGTGSFQLAVPSCNAANNASTGDIVTTQ